MILQIPALSRYESNRRESKSEYDSDKGETICYSCQGYGECMPCVCGIHVLPSFGEVNSFRPKSSLQVEREAANEVLTQG